MIFSPTFMRGTRRAGLLAIAVLAFLAGMPRAHSDPAAPLEYRVKAAFLYNFAQFVEWPDTVTNQAPFTIGVLGDDPVQQALEETIAGKTLRNRPVRIKRLGRSDSLGDCHILFISASEKTWLPQILARLKTASVLTVSDLPEFARQGGIISLMTQDHRIRFEINTAAAERAQLKISSKLLRLAEIVSASTEGENR